MCKQCSVSCGEGIQTRTIGCKDGSKPSSIPCDEFDKPASIQTCDSGIRCPDPKSTGKTNSLKKKMSPLKLEQIN